MTALEDPFVGSIADCFEAFHDDNRHVYDTLVELARQWRDRHPERQISIALLVEVARWEHMMRTYDTNSEFKISNSYRAFYARLMMASHADLAGLFNLKQSEADEWISDYLLRHNSDPCGIVEVSTTHTQPAGEHRAMTELTFDGQIAPTPPRTTKTMGYPLPPEPPRVKSVYDGWGRYKLPAPRTGRPTAFTRSTTVASTLDDTYNLNRWKRRETAKNVILAGEEIGTARADLFQSLMDAIKEESKSGIDKALDAIDNACGGRDAAELGEAVHAWLEALDLGSVLLHQIPEQFQPYAVSYQAVLARYGLVAEPQYVERIVLNDRGETTVAGTLDRIYRVVSTGELILGDVKTSRTLEHSYLTYAIQLAVYGYATKILATDGSGWEPMPEINQQYAVILHVPSDQPERGDLVTIDLWQGGEGMMAALEVRRRRSEATKKIPFIHAVPVPTPEALRHVEARQALQNVPHAEAVSDVWTQFADVWNDELTALGEQIIEVLTNAPAHANAEQEQ